MVNYEKVEMEKLLRPIVRWDCRAMAKNFTFIEDPVDYLMRESYRHYSLDQRDQLTTLVHLIGHTRPGDSQFNSYGISGMSLLTESLLSQ